MDTHTHQKQTGLVRQLSTRLIFSASLLIGALLFRFIAGQYTANAQYNLSQQEVRIQNDTNGILIAMVNRETGLRGYIATNNTVFLEPYHSSLLDYSSAIKQLTDETNSSNFQQTTAALIQVEKWVNDWSNRYAQSQIQIMERGNLPLAEAAIAAVKDGLDHIRDSVAHI